VLDDLVAKAKQVRYADPISQLYAIPPWLHAR
jgi:hypothetical protein